MTATLLALLLFASIAAVRFAMLRPWTSAHRYRLEPEGDVVAGVCEPARASEGVREPAGDSAGRSADALAPAVAVIVPARNEEEHLDETLASLAVLDYPSYRVVVVDDGSTDRTPAIACEFCQRWDRFSRLTITERPEGWGGKTWALERGLQETDEPWVLFTDADVVHHPASLARAMERARRTGAEMVSVVPRFVCESFWERLIMPAFCLVVAHRFPPGRVCDPRSRVAAAAGGFLLVRREALERAGGLSPVRGRVAEDVAIARRLKRSGARIDLSYTRGLLSTRMYSSFGEIAEGLGKHAHEGMADSTVVLVATVAVSWIITVFPLAVLLALGVISPILGLPPLHGPVPQSQGIVCAIAAANYVGMKRLYEEWVDFLEVPFGYSWSYPLAAIFYGLIALRAVGQRHFTGGPQWKGRRVERA